MIFQVGLIILAYRLRHLFAGYSSWEVIWASFGTAFLMMLISRTLNVVDAPGQEAPGIRYAQRYIAPLIVSGGLYAGLALLHRLLSHFPSQLPHLELPDPAGINIDEQSIVMAWDAHAEEMFGWSAAEAVGQRLTTLIIPARLQQGHRAGVDRYLREREERSLSVQYEVTAHHKDGREFQVIVRISVVPQPDGSIQFASMINRLGY